MIAAWPVLQGVLFAAWAFWMFRCLFRLRTRAVAQTGSVFPGPGATLRTFGAFVTDPEHARDRRILLGLTLAMFAAIAGWAALVRTDLPV